ncbi:TonB-dependent receptor [Hirschia maritima]|uniref:TonB-dependent receptor n=1 Tax=Hirschia maritima TaxID=1121961 RepID=UPI0003817628|nr:TonB-dependent receptor [Hirschia maritima]
MTKNIKPSLFAGAAFAALALSSQVAFAQVSSETDAVVSVEDDAQRKLDTIVVTGIRQSLAAAVDRKRNSDDIIDSIVAEDIGKFPDTNVAESLARISGVSIDRAGGEGSQVTVRGFGPGFNTVLVDGRRIATDTAGRNFRFDLIGADLLGGADIFKTSAPHLQAGGIGSTIDLKLHKPLDTKGFRAVTSARGVYEANSEEFAPQLFGLVSNTFADDRIGVLASVSYQTRKAAQDQIAAGNFIGQNISEERATTLFADGVGNGPGVYRRQQQTRFSRANQDRDRLGATAVVQFEVAENARISVDALYSKLEVEADSIFNFQFNEAATFTNAITDENNILVRYDQIGRPFQAAVETNRDAETYQIGANLEWDITDNFSAEFDISRSEAEDDNAGNNFFFVVAGPQAVQRFDYTQGGDAPTFQNFEFTPSTVDLNGDGVVNNFDRTVGNEILAPDPNNTFSWFGTREGQGSTDEVTELQANFVWNADMGIFQKLSFGGYYGDQEKSRSDARTRGGGGGVSNAFLQAQIPLPASLFTLENNSNFLNQVDGNFPSNFLQYDPEEVIAYLESPEAFQLRDELNGLAPGTTAARIGDDFFDALDIPRNSFTIGEEIIALYANAQFEAQIGSMDLTVNAGLRYTETETTSTAFSEPFANIGPDLSRPDVLESSRLPAQNISQTEKYDNLLPSITARLNATENFVFRAGYSQTLTRPNLTDLNPGINTAPEIRLSALEATSGNPALLPFVSDNYDFSAEYYFGESSAFTVGIFRKEISGFIARGAQREEIVLPPGNDLNLITEDRTNISGDSIFFEITRPRNLEETTVDGVELSFQHTFDQLPGVLQYVGVGANATFVDSGDKVENDLIDNAVALPGLGNSQNFVLFYDDTNIEARIAYNNRERFFSSTQGAEPVFTNRYDQVDARIAWNYRENVQFFLEGLNLTESVSSRVGRFTSRFGGLEDSGARYTIGARASF